MPEQQTSMRNREVAQEQGRRRALIPYPTNTEVRQDIDTNVIRHSLAVLPIVAIEEVL